MLYCFQINLQDPIAKRYWYDEITCAELKYVNLNVMQNSVFTEYLKNHIMHNNDLASTR